VTLHWADLAWMTALVMAGCGVGYWLAMRKVREAVAESQRKMERRLQSLIEAVAKGGANEAEVESTDVLDTVEIEAKPAAAIQGRPLPRVEVQGPAAAGEADAIAPEIQAAITAAAMATLGNHARVRTARRIPSEDVVSPWTQQGRVIVQSSHNLRTRGR
jgi:hypothetical protein